MTAGKKAFFLDIDGTLSQNGAAPGPEDVLALREARAAGHFVFINTGRSLGCVPPVLRQADYLDGLLCGCGTHLVMGGKTVFTATLKRPLLRRIAAFYLARPDRFCMIEGEENVYHCNGPLLRPDCRRVTREDDFEGVFAQARITKLTVLGVGRADDQERALLAGEMELVEQSGANWHEAILPGNGKGRGMRRVCAHLGIPLENSVSVGDSDNDLDMFAHAGVAVAMENATDAAREAAQLITGPCGRGVAQAVRALALRQGSLRPAQG